MLDGNRNLPGERLEHVEVVGPEVGAAEHEHVVAGQRHREIGGFGPFGHRRPHAGDDDPAGTRRGGQHPDRLRPERGLHLGDELRQRIRHGHEGAAERRQGLGLGPCMRRLHRAARRGRDEHADHPADEQEDHEREEVLTLGDRELVEGWGEEPVGEQEAGDRADEGRNETTERGDDHDQKQEHEQIARERQDIAELGEDQRHERRAAERERPGQRASTPRHGEDPLWSSPSRRIVSPARRSLVGRCRDHVDVDVARGPDHVGDHRSPDQVRPARLLTRTEHDLGGVLGVGEPNQRRGRIGAGDLAVLAAELVEQPSLVVQLAALRSAQPVGRPNMHTDELAVRPRRHACRAPNHVVATGRARDRDHYPFPRFPWAVNAMRLAVLLERLVHPIGEPHQRELTQRTQVPLAEEVGERRVDLLGRIDVAVGHAPAQRFR